MTKIKGFICLLLSMIAISSCEPLFHADLEEQEVILLTPADSLSMEESWMQFNWSSLDDAEQYQFQLSIIDEASSFFTIYSDSMVSDTFFRELLTPGEYQWAVRGVNDASETEFSTFALTVVPNPSLFIWETAAIDLISPENEVELNSGLVDFSWSSLPVLANYRFQLSEELSFSNLLLDTLKADSSFQYVVDQGLYYWRVRGESETDSTDYTVYSFEVDSLVSISDWQPQLIVPADNAELNQSPVVFEWSEASIPADYDLQISTDGFALAASTTNYPGTSTFQTIELPNGNYSWRVRAQANEEWSTYSAIANFSLDISDDLSEQTVQLYQPITGSLFIELPIELQWVPLEGAVDYQIQIAENDFILPSNIIVDAALTENSYLLEELAAGNYVWRVKASDGLTETAFSSEWSISYQPELDISATQLSLLFPEDLADLINPSVDFSWTPIEEVTNYIVQLKNEQEVVQEFESASPTYNTNLLAGQHQWRVKATNEYSESQWSDWRTISYTPGLDLTGLAIDLFSPPSELIVIELPLELKWVPLDNVINYQLQVAQDDFIIPSNTIIDETQSETIYTIQSLQEGNYVWQVQGTNPNSMTDISSYWSFSYLPQLNISNEQVQLLFPHDMTTTVSSMVNFSWAEITEATNYIIQLKNEMDVVQEFESTVANFAANLESGEYMWRVKGINEYSEGLWADWRSLSYSPDLDLSAVNVDLFSPVNESLFISLPIEFQWVPVANAQDYQVQIAQTDFILPSNIQIDMQQAASTLMINSLDEGEYEWRVKAGNFNSETEFSSSWSFSYQPQLEISGEQASLLAPSDLFTTTEPAIYFSWTEIVEATNYIIQLQDAQGGIVEFESNVPSYGTSLLIGEYSWRVKGLNQYSESLWSAWRTVSYQPGLDLSEESIYLFSPVDGASLAETEIQFLWDPITEAESYEFEVASPDFSSSFNFMETTSLAVNEYFFDGGEGEFTWRVRAVNAWSESPWSTATFSVDATAPEIPQQLLPAHLDTSFTTSVNFSWLAADDAVSTELSIVSGSVSGPLVDQQNVSGTSATVNLPAGLNYFWRIRSQDAIGNLSSHSSWRKITVE